jgi:hypothetical protein
MKLVFFLKKRRSNVFFFIFRDLFVSKENMKEAKLLVGTFSREPFNMSIVCRPLFFFFYHTHWRIIDEEARAAPPVKRPCQNKLLPLLALLLTYTCEWGDAIGA